MSTLTRRAIKLITMVIGANEQNILLAQVAGNTEQAMRVSQILSRRRPQRDLLQARLENAGNPDCPECGFPMRLEPANSDGSGRYWGASYGCTRDCGYAVDARELCGDYEPDKVAAEVYGPIVRIGQGTSETFYPRRMA